MIKYKIDVIAELKKVGYTPTKIRTEKIFSEATMSNIREGKMVNLETLNRICCILRKTPNDVLFFEMTDEEKIKYFY